LRYVLSKPSPPSQRDFYERLRPLHPSPLVTRLAKRTLHASYRKFIAAAEREFDAGIPIENIFDESAANLPAKYRHQLWLLKIRAAAQEAISALSKKSRYPSPSILPEAPSLPDQMLLPAPYFSPSEKGQRQAHYSTADIGRRFAITHESKWEKTPEFSYLLEGLLARSAGISFRLDHPIFKQVAGLAARMRFALALRYLESNPFSWEKFPPDLQKDPAVYQAAVQQFRLYIFHNLPSRPALPPEFPNIYENIERDVDFIEFCKLACRTEDISKVPSYQQSMAKDEARTAWVKLLLSFPNQISACPDFLRHDPDLLQAELDGWCQWIAEDIESLQECPENLRSHPQVRAWVKSLLDLNSRRSSFNTNQEPGT
jgi:hypothetical protein